MKLTRENIHAGFSDEGGVNWKQLRLLGVAPPPIKGWLSALIGKEVPDEVYQQFLKLRKPSQLLLPIARPNEKKALDFANVLYEKYKEEF